MTSSHVERIIMEGGRAVGVELRGGSIIRASKAVVSNASVWDTVNKLLPEGQVPEQVGWLIGGRPDAWILASVIMGQVLGKIL